MWTGFLGMRIAMIGQKGIPCKGGGVERHVEELSVELVRAGHEVIVYTRPHYTRASLTSFHGVTLVSLPSLRAKHFDAITHTLLATLDALRRKVEVIHYHGVGPALLSWIPRLIAPSVRVVGTFHSADWLHEKWGIVARGILRAGAYMISAAPHVTIGVSRDIVRMVKAYTGRRALYIPSGVRISETAPSRTCLKRFKLESVPYVLVVSRFVKHKCIHEALEAFVRMKEHPRLPRHLRAVKLVLVGGSAFTDSYVAALKAQAQGRKDIVFTGFQNGETLHALYAHASAFVQPSVAEGRSISLMEAAAWGVPVAAADITETRELLVPGGIHKKPLGTLFPPHDVEALGIALRVLLTRRAAALRMGARAREYVKKAYPWGTIAGWIDAVYIRLGAHEMSFGDIEYALAQAETKIP